MWTFLDPTASDPRSQVLASIIKSFEADNPGVTIQVVSKPYQTLTSAFLSAATAGNAPDITWTVLDDLSTVVGQNSLVDLSSSGAFPASDTSDFSVWDQLKVNGKGPYGVVMSLNYFGLLYRTDLLKKAGLTANDLSTWDGFASAVKKLTDSATGVTGFGQAYAGPQGDPQIMVPMTLDSQDSMFTSDGKANWDTQAAVAALKYETDLVSSGATSKSAAQWQPNDLYDQFAAGRIAIINGASTRVSTMQGQIGADKVGYAPYPSTTGTAGRMFSGWSVGVWQGSKNKEAAEKFVAYMASKDSDKLWADKAGQIPGRKSTLESDTSLPDYIKTAAEGVAKNGWRPPLDVSTAGWIDDVNEAAQNVVLNGQAPEAALKASVEKFNAAQSK